MSRKSDIRPYHVPFIEVLIDNVLHNFRRIGARAHGSEVIAVVKDQAYGCGALPIAQALEREGVRFFAVARTGEAEALRKGRITSPILVLGEASADEIEWGSSHHVRFTLNRLENLHFWRSIGVPITFHVNIDSGMTRLGIPCEGASDLVEALGNSHQLRCEGIFTHFASADIPATDSVGCQYDRFAAVLVQLHEAGIKPLVHLSNSAAIARFGEISQTLIRPGIVLYGCNPDPEQDFGLELKTVVNLKAPVVRVQSVAAGTPVSYGGTYTTDRDTCIGTIAAGYAHGVPRLLSNDGFVLLQGRRHPIAGRVTMDYIMVDLGPNTSVQPGDQAVILGYQGEECITADEIARKAGTIGYEILCNLSSVVDRYIIEGGKTVHHYKRPLL